MSPQKLRPLLEALQTGPLKNLSGEVRVSSQLLCQESLARLDERHSGIYAIFVYDARADGPVAEYLKLGSLANDAGRNILALYESAPSSSVAEIAHEPDEDLKIVDVSPMVAFVRAQFPKRHVVLPGILLIERLAAPKNCVYIPLTGQSEAEVTRSARDILRCSAQAIISPPPETSFAHAVGLNLAKAGLPYTRGEPLSFEENLIKLLRSLWSARKDLLALIPLVGKATGSSQKT